MRILLTGANGFLGSSLAEHWRALGHEVRDSGGCRLGEELPCALPAGCDAVIHLAHDFAPNAAAVNMQGTMSWFEAASRAGVRWQVFVSSFSARPDSLSSYGSAKYAIEQHVLEQGATVVRPGLVAGNGGMFARMVRTLHRLPVAPLVLPDARSVAVISLSDFLEAMTKLMVECATGPFNLFCPALLTGREFTHAIWSAMGKKGLVIEVPPSVAIACLRLTGASSALDSVRGQLANAVPIHRGDLASLILRPTDPAVAVTCAARGVVND
ncbi:MAG: hypothetical protein JNK48_22975 [Bryobacterales bacterium]|nr:hypothetical protein [Bryobacterales bacterium]